jgi:tRNA(His) guanylyltransferase
MNAAAVEVLKDLPDLAIAYGVSDEYRFDLTNSRRSN